MDQFGFGAQLETSPVINELAKRLLAYETRLMEIKYTIDEMNRKVDFLLARSTADHAQELNNLFAPGNIGTLGGSRHGLTAVPHQFLFNAAAPNQNLIHNGPGINGEFAGPGTCTASV